MNKIFLLSFVFLFILAEQLQAAAEGTPLKKFNALRVDESIVIDGILSEDIWKSPGYTNFIQQDPENGKPASLRSEVWFAYDDEAVYLGGRFYDDHPDSIMARLVRRDFIWGDPSDGCVLYLDSYNDKRSGYFFYVSAAGALADGLIDNDVKMPNDLTWDAVWDGAANIDSEGWSAEMRIPYSQLRFREEEAQLWGINVERFISRRVETDMISHTPRNETGFASRFTELTGIKGIKPVSRIELLPYVTGKAEYTGSNPGNPFNSGSKYTPNVGLDIRAGLSNSLTLNATINPDFGQVEVDPAVVNLSDVEYSFQEKRPFFTEGVTVYSFGNGGITNNASFNWVNPNLVYSRRIGRHPQGRLPQYDYADMPEGTRILGAAKISGQIFDDWKIGTIHALTNREYARIDAGGIRSDVEVEPLSYYGVFRTQRDFNSGQQGFGILSTYVNRFFKDESLNNSINGNAVVAAADAYTFLDDNRTYVISGWGGLSRVSGTEDRMIALQQNSGHYFQRPDASHLNVDTSITSMTGYAGRVQINKNRGQFVFNSAAGFVSPKFEINDMGYNPYSDLINMHFMASYRWLEPTSYYRQTGISAAAYASYDFGGYKTYQGYYLGTFFTHTSHNGINLNFNYYPKSFNARRTRGGPLTLNPVSRSFNANINTDFRKDWVLYAGSYGRFGEDLNNFSSYVNVELKVTPTLTVAVGPRDSRSISAAQWVGAYNDPEAADTYGRRYIFARLDQKIFAAEIRTDWIINPRLSFQVYLQPLIASGNYTDIKMLQRGKSYDFTLYGEEGSSIEKQTLASGQTVYRIDADGAGPSQTRTIGNPDFNYISLRGNAVLRWEYISGSTLYLVWTQSRENYLSTGDFDFRDSVSDMFTIHPDNIFMLKLTYLL
jgi:hypothetical protein